MPYEFKREVLKNSKVVNSVLPFSDVPERSSPLTRSKKGGSKQKGDFEIGSLEVLPPGVGTLNVMCKGTVL